MPPQELLDILRLESWTKFMSSLTKHHQDFCGGGKKCGWGVEFQGPPLYETLHTQLKNVLPTPKVHDAGTHVPLHFQQPPNGTYMYQELHHVYSVA